MSAEAKASVRRMLTLEPALRPRAADLLREPWLCAPAPPPDAPAHTPHAPANAPHASANALHAPAHPPLDDLRRAVDLTFQVTKLVLNGFEPYVTAQNTIFKGLSHRL